MVVGRGGDDALDETGRRRGDDGHLTGPDALSGLDDDASAYAARAFHLLYGTQWSRPIDGERDGLRVTLRDDGGSDLALRSGYVVCMNYGFHPQNEMLRLLGASFDYDPVRAQLDLPEKRRLRDDGPGPLRRRRLLRFGRRTGSHGGRTDRRLRRRGVGAWPREQASTAAGSAAARPAPALSKGALDAVCGRTAKLRRYRPSRHAVLCRCEGLSRGEIEGPASEKGIEIGGVKRATRAGMGRCQGRYCAQVLATENGCSPWADDRRARVFRPSRPDQAGRDRRDPRSRRSGP